MRHRPHILFASVLLVAMLPVTVQGYGLSDYPGDRGCRPYAGPAGGNHFPVSVRLQTGITRDGYFVRACLEGVHPEDVQVYPRNNHLVLQITQGNQRRLFNHGSSGVARWQMRFRRQLRLPYDADWTRMTVSMKHGIMEIYIPRSSQYMPADPPPGTGKARSR